jgi:hypothetical protein
MPRAARRDRTRGDRFLEDRASFFVALAAVAAASLLRREARPNSLVEDVLRGAAKMVSLSASTLRQIDVEARPGSRGAGMAATDFEALLRQC